MIPPQLEELYRTWTNKANEYNTDSLRDAFDKYISLFIVFNGLYNQVSFELKRSGASLTKKYNDRNAATDCVVQFVGSKKITEMIVQKNLRADVDTLIKIIDNNSYNIKLNWGESQREEDLKIASMLKSKRADSKALAMVEIIYYVRCNLFHGHKLYEDYQKELLKPLIRFLECLNELIYEHLSISMDI